MLKRLFPDSEFSRHLCALLNPFTKVPAKISLEEWMDKLVEEHSYQEQMISNATNYFFTKQTKNEILYSVFFKLKTLGCTITQTTEHENIISQQIQEAGFILSKEIMNQAKKLNFMDLIETIVSPVYKSFINKACNLITLSTSRAVLSSWLENVKDNTVLFVDAPMGLGKTCSIVKTLSDDLTISAVVFLPTKKLCREIEFNLKNAIAWKLGIYPRVHFEGTEYYRYYYKEDINSEEYSVKISRFKRRFLKNHVYYLDGINEQECPFYEEIISQYQNRWYQKREFCLKCPYNTSCRFFHHFESAKKSRIVITTHQQYLNFFNNDSNWYWVDEKPDANEKKRDLFIIDEDLVLKICYSPIELSMKELKFFYATITKFIRDNFYNRPFYRETIDNINKLYAQHNKSDKTVLIPPINSDFEMPNEIKEKWKTISSENEQLQIIPDFIDWNHSIPNLLDLVEHAIRNGFVIQDYKTNISPNNSQDKRRIKKIFYPNPTTLVFDGQPSHVIFDGTMLHEKFLIFKIKNADFDKLSIDIEPIWKYEVKQNINTDLPKTKVSQYESKVKEYVKNVLETNGINRHYQ